jgi:hypothetical protein
VKKSELVLKRPEDILNVVLDNSGKFGVRWIEDVLLKMVGLAPGVIRLVAFRH